LSIAQSCPHKATDDDFPADGIDLAPFAGRHHLIEFEKHLGRDGE
jgi:hypothetical protein